MPPIYEQVGPYLIEYIMHIPLAIIGFVIMWRAGQFKKSNPGGRVILVLVIFVFVLFVFGEWYWHFKFPTVFPLHETIFQ